MPRFADLRLPNSSYRFKLPLDSNLDIPTGQHVRLAADVVLSDGSSQRCVRSYTPIAIDDEARYFELVIKSYPLGKLSNYISSLDVGQNIQVCGPQGRFIYRPNMAARLGMIAGGTGITPMLPILRTVLRGRAGGKDSTTIDLIFANSTVQDILFKDELDEMTRTDPNFRIHYVLSKAPDDWTGGAGHVTSDMISVSFSTLHFFLPSSFLSNTP